MDNNWKEIHTTQGEGETSVISSLLESENIPVKIIRESIGRLYSISVDGLGKAKIFVPADKADEAFKLINTACSEIEIPEET